MGIRLKIFAGFMILAIMLLIAGFISIHEFMNIGNYVQKLLDDNYRSIEASRTMVEALEREDSGILLLLMGNWGEGRKILKEGDNLFNKGFSSAENNLTIPGEYKYIERIRKDYDNYKKTWERPIVGTDKEGNFEWYYNKSHQLFLQVKGSVKKLMEINQEKMYETGSDLKNRSQRAVMPGIVAIIAAVVFTVLFNYFVNYYIARPIVQLTRGIEEYKNTGEIFKFTSETGDEIGRLTSAIKEMLQSLTISSTEK
jgi:methyl-accepting chemotaxis protein